MSSKSAAKAVSRVIPVGKKYTIQSTGVWELIRRFFAVDPSRSNGVPLNPEFRNPPPGSNPPNSFTDAVTAPAADVADNPYWKRDVRRGYSQRSIITQGDVVGLLSLGNQASPKKELIGEAGSKELTSVREEGQMGLASYFDKEGKQTVLTALGKDGLPPLPSGRSLKTGADKYELTEENAYPDVYPCRTFQ